MKDFAQRRRRKILAALSGFDRTRLRGSPRPLTTVGVLLKDFARFAENLIRQIR